MTLPLSYYSGIPQVYKCPDCAEKDDEITELKAQLISTRCDVRCHQNKIAELVTRLEAADAMNKELHKVNTELQEKLTAETKRADEANPGGR
jgi:uncharacterized coiled-coil protein SlyX